MGLKTLYADARVRVVDKLAGVSMAEIEGLPAHRLDRDTSGALLVAKDEQALEFFRKQFKDRTVKKQYICLVEGNLAQDSGVVHTLLGRSPADRRKQKAYPLAEPKEGRREARTEWRVLGRFEGYTLLEVTPKTGRKHQVRAHMASLGHPVAGDRLYGFKNQKIPRGLTRHFLHASSLELELPGGARKRFESPLPEDLRAILQTLRTSEHADG